MMKVARSFRMAMRTTTTTSTSWKRSKMTPKRPQLLRKAVSHTSTGTSPGTDEHRRMGHSDQCWNVGPGWLFVPGRLADSDAWKLRYTAAVEEIQVNAATEGAI